MAAAQVHGAAIFSTKLGKLSPRVAEIPLPAVIVKSNGYEDVRRFTAKLRKEFPEQCGRLFRGTPWNLPDYFDSYDIHREGPRFLSAVMQDIAEGNNRAVVEFTVQWSIANEHRLRELCRPVTLNSVFTDAERTRYGDEFLTHALIHMRFSLQFLYNEQQEEKARMAANGAAVKKTPRKMKAVSTSQQREPSEVAKSVNRRDHISTVIEEQEAQFSTNPQRTPVVKGVHGGQAEAERTPDAPHGQVPQADVQAPITASVPQVDSGQRETRGLQEPDAYTKLPVKADGGVKSTKPEVRVSSSPAAQSPRAVSSVHGTPHVRSPLVPQAQPSRLSSYQYQQPGYYSTTPQMASTQPALISAGSTPKIPYQHLTQTMGRGSPLAWPRSPQLGQQVLSAPMTPSAMAAQPIPQTANQFAANYYAPFPMMQPMGGPPTHLGPVTWVPSPTGQPFTSNTNVPYGTPAPPPGQPYRQNRPSGTWHSEPWQHTDVNAGYMGGPTSGKQHGRGGMSNRGNRRKSSASGHPPFARSNGGYATDSRRQDFPPQQAFSQAPTYQNDPVYHQKSRRPSELSVEPFPPFRMGDGENRRPEMAKEVSGPIDEADTCRQDFIGGNREDVMQLWVGNMPPNVTEEMLASHFSQVIPVSHVTIKAVPDNHRPYAFIDTHSSADARKGLQLNGTKLNEHILRVHVPLKFIDHFHYAAVMPYQNRNTTWGLDAHHPRRSSNPTGMAGNVSYMNGGYGRGTGMPPSESDRPFNRRRGPSLGRSDQTGTGTVPNAGEKKRYPTGSRYSPQDARSDMAVLQGQEEPGHDSADTMPRKRSTPKKKGSSDRSNGEEPAYPRASGPKGKRKLQRDSNGEAVGSSDYRTRVSSGADGGTLPVHTIAEVDREGSSDVGSLKPAKETEVARPVPIELSEHSETVISTEEHTAESISAQPAADKSDTAPDKSEPAPDASDPAPTVNEPAPVASEPVSGITESAPAQQALLVNNAAVESNDHVQTSEVSNMAEENLRTAASDPTPEISDTAKVDTVESTHAVDTEAPVPAQAIENGPLSSNVPTALEDSVSLSSSKSKDGSPIAQRVKAEVPRAKDLARYDEESKDKTGAKPSTVTSSTPEVQAHSGGSVTTEEAQASGKFEDSTVKAGPTSKPGIGEEATTERAPSPPVPQSGEVTAINTEHKTPEQSNTETLSKPKKPVSMSSDSIHPFARPKKQSSVASSSKKKTKAKSKGKRAHEDEVPIDGTQSVGESKTHPEPPQLDRKSSVKSSAEPDLNQVDEQPKGDGFSGHEAHAEQGQPVEAKSASTDKSPTSTEIPSRRSRSRQPFADVTGGPPKSLRGASDGSLRSSGKQQFVENGPTERSISGDIPLRTNLVEPGEGELADDESASQSLGVVFAERVPGTRISSPEESTSQEQEKKTPSLPGTELNGPVKAETTELSVAHVTANLPTQEPEKHGQHTEINSNEREDSPKSPSVASTDATSIVTLAHEPDTTDRPHAESSHDVVGEAEPGPVLETGLEPVQRAVSFTESSNTNHAPALIDKAQTEDEAKKPPTLEGTGEVLSSFDVSELSAAPAVAKAAPSTATKSKKKKKKNKKKVGSKSEENADGLGESATQAVVEKQPSSALPPPPGDDPSDPRTDPASSKVVFLTPRSIIMLMER